MSKILIFVILFLIKIYNYLISPLLGIKCRFFPSCSEYTRESLKLHGLSKGAMLSIKRLLKCHPFKIFGGSSGVDLVPEKKIKSKGLN
tara:strand:- start:624 stop:887 length:264 start_codon:yes stop_codon:yes gene_type:complete